MADDETPPPDDDNQSDQPPPDPPQGDDGTDWKKEARKHERNAKRLQGEVTTLQQAGETAADAALRSAREEGQQAALADLTPQLTAARLEAAVLRSAGTKLADPGDALRFIDAATVTDDGGAVDVNKLGSSIDELIVSKPYLAAGFKPAPPGVQGGPRGATDGPTDMNDLIRQRRS